MVWRATIRPSAVAEFVSFNRQFLRELAAPQDLQPVELSVHQPFFAQELLRDMRTIFELLEVAQVHQAVRSLELGVIKSPLWQPSDQRHLTAFESKPDASS